MEEIDEFEKIKIELEEYIISDGYGGVLLENKAINVLKKYKFQILKENQLAGLNDEKVFWCFVASNVYPFNYPNLSKSGKIIFNELSKFFDTELKKRYNEKEILKLKNELKLREGVDKK